MVTFSATCLCRIAVVSAGFLAALGTHSGVQAQSTAESADAASSPGVRIVRLSEIRGQVTLDRNVGHGYEAAFQNLPIVQGAKLKTDQGVAEVEFEDNSSLRVTPDSIIEFPRLARDATGGTVTNINILRGTVYVSLSDSHTNTFLITNPQGKVTVTPSTHLQFNSGNPTSTLAVYKGAAQAQIGSSLMTVDQKKTLTFGATGEVQPQLLSHIEEGAYDGWDKTSVDYHKRYMNSFDSSRGVGQAAVSGVYSGLSDLGYYGNFSDIGGCGSLWRPYFTDASWDPYGNGIFAQYAGGYSWVSPYPWGWLPYHSGSWEQCGGSWGWRPGNTYVGLANTSLTVKPTLGTGRSGPPHHPIIGGPSLVAIHNQPLSVSKVANGDSFIFAKNSAGLGVPRLTFGNLQHASNHLDQHGSAMASMASFAPISPGSASGYAPGNGNRSMAPPAHNSVAAPSGFSGASHGSSGPSGSAASSSGHK